MSGVRARAESGPRGARPPWRSPLAASRVALPFVATLFVSSTLLFACQPLVARMILPLLGGAPSVWILCSVVFQGLLLGGYLYAHGLTRLRVRAQIVVHLGVLASAFVVLPVAVDEGRARTLLQTAPALGLLSLLLATAGLPFFVLSTTSPLLQRWFAETGERDPYHLYTASNAGSMLALLGYPFLVEPFIALRAQSRILSWGYAAYAALVIACGWTTVRRQRAGPDPELAPTPSPDPLTEPIASGRVAGRSRAAWIGLAFAPSSLMLGATEYVTTDIASVPLFWVLPLALYLGSYLVAFSKRERLPRGWASRALPPLALLVAATMIANLAGPAWLVVGGHLAVVFVASVVCHRALAARRPPVAHLTEFYLLIAVGGVLGGLFNGLLAPHVFHDLVEYPIAIGAVCLGRAAGEASPDPRPTRAFLLDAAAGAAIGAVASVLAILAARAGAAPVLLVAIFVPAFAIAFAWRARPVRFAFAVALLTAAGMRESGQFGVTLFRSRNLFGTLRVADDVQEGRRLLVSGRTAFGEQRLDPREKDIPRGPYHPTGPAGDVLGGHDARGRSIGVVGLGVGALAAYARPTDRWTFFEQDPAVVFAAQTYFSYLRDVPAGARVNLEIGDARLRLRPQPSAPGVGCDATKTCSRFDVLVLDSFSADAVPVHLLTREAFEMYRRSLAPGGLLLIHLDNPHLDLTPVVAALGRDLDLEILTRGGPGDDSSWVAIGDRSASTKLRERTPPWRDVHAPRAAAWTDDFANVLGALRFWSVKGDLPAGP